MSYPEQDQQAKHLNFSSLGISLAMVENLDSLGYRQMTPIQSLSLPLLLQRRDILAQAQTGTGKTVAFGVALLESLDLSQFRLQSMVLCPTRELAEQVTQELRRLARFAENIKILTLAGGKPLGPQLGSLEHGVHIIVGTPGRINQHIRKGSLPLGGVATLVLDEADRMLDMGFHEQISLIIAELPAARTTWLFSATFPDAIRELSQSIQSDAAEVEAESVSRVLDITQVCYQVESTHKLSSLLNVFGHYQPDSAIVFCNTRQGCQEVAGYLRAAGVSALALHGEMEQRDRDQALIQFSNGSTRVLVATDVAARGLDVKNLGAVIVFDLSRELDVHVHRIGRTGRAGESGLAVTLYTDREKSRLEALESHLKSNIRRLDVVDLKGDSEAALPARMRTLCIDAGRKEKLRPTDILGALTAGAGLDAEVIGKIDIRDHNSYVAIERGFVGAALTGISQGKIKGRRVKIRKL